jgi:DNA-binding NtrC family response regulator
VHHRHAQWAARSPRAQRTGGNPRCSAVAHPLRFPVGVMNTMPAPSTTATPLLPIGYHGAVSDFKRRLIEATLHQMRGNRTHTARALGLQRTYLLRLIRELGVAAPPPPPRRRSAES